MGSQISNLLIKNNMALRERLIRETVGVPGAGNGNGNGNGQEGSPHSFQEVKSRLHRTLINRMDLTKLSSLTPEQVHAEVSRLAENVLAQEVMPLSTSERERSEEHTSELQSHLNLVCRL